MQEVKRYQLDKAGLSSESKLLERGWTLFFLELPRVRGTRQVWGYFKAPSLERGEWEERLA